MIVRDIGVCLTQIMTCNDVLLSVQDPKVTPALVFPALPVTPDPMATLVALVTPDPMATLDPLERQDRWDPQVS